MIKDAATIEHMATQFLQNLFGYKTFRDQQLEIIKSIVNQQDNLVIMPTGGGKSLCYQIPALMLDGTAIIISPLIALMKDQVDKLLSYNVKVAYLNGTQTYEEQLQTIELYNNQTLKLLYIAPERIFTHNFLSMINQNKPSFIAIDEAHCISQWGHDFRPEYLQIGQLKNNLANVPFIALTATADEHTRDDIVSRLQFKNPQISISSFDRPNIQYTVIEQHNQLDQIVGYLANKKDQSGIIYCSSRARVEDLASRLKLKDFNVAAYHAGMNAHERNLTQEKFLKNEILIIVATVAFGMGINKPDVRFVIHANMPRSIEAYYQETGRAGRDGLPAEALLLYNTRDSTWYQKLLDEKAEDDQKKVEQHKLNEMIAFTQSQICRRIVLLNYFGEHKTSNCNNCDICLYPLEKYDGLIDAQKILSCIYRLQQKHAMQYVVDVLRGSNKIQIKQNKHDALSVYGIGKDKSEKYWISIIRQLIHLGYLKQNVMPNSSLYLTENARKILKGDCDLALVKPRTDLIKNLKNNRYSKTLAQSALLSYSERKLFDKLTSLRSRIAKENNKPAFFVFSDQSILDMVKKIPTTELEFSHIYGVGVVKSKQYSHDFINAINEFYANEP